MINVQLEKIYLEDHDKREAYDSLDPEGIKNLEAITEKHIKLVKEIVKSDKFDKSEIWNLHYAAYVLQHSNKVDDIKLAHEFASMAVALGSSVTKWLYAATLDRLLLSTGKAQKYGTQYKFEAGKWNPQPVDMSTTDQERIKYGVKPLKKYLKFNYK